MFAPPTTTTSKFVRSWPSAMDPPPPRVAWPPCIGAGAFPLQSSRGERGIGSGEDARTNENDLGCTLDRRGGGRPAALRRSHPACRRRGDRAVRARQWLLAAEPAQPPRRD